MKPDRTIHWFRKGLRIHDNPALLAAIKDSSHLWPVYVLDPEVVATANVGVNRWRFLLEALKDLDARLSEIGSRLFVVRGSPDVVFRRLFDDWQISKLTYEEDVEPDARKTDAVVGELAKEKKVKVIVEVSHTIWDLERIVAANGGKPPLTYVKFQKVVASLGAPPKPRPEPKRLVESCVTPQREAAFRVPETLLNMGLEGVRLEAPSLSTPSPFPGGESHALERMKNACSNPTWVAKFEKPQTAPNSLQPSTTVLSPYLRFGCLSPRTFWYKLKETLELHCGNNSQPPVSLEGQMLWREFYYCAAAFTPNFDKMEGNPICVQVDWDESPGLLKAWTKAQTGYPFIDAIMTQLRVQGWIHHLARHAVACFLTRGDMWVSWERGQHVFEELLLDADWALNAGNWMWLSASAFFHQFYRVYSPVAFGKKTDKSGEYIRHWLPVLRRFPDEYIYEPWRAPASVQRAAQCVIGVDYPKRVVDHDLVHKTNIQRMKTAYARRKSEGVEGEVESRTAESSTIATKTSTQTKRRSANADSAKITKFFKKK